VRTFRGEVRRGFTRVRLHFNYEIVHLYLLCTVNTLAKSFYTSGSDPFTFSPAIYIYYYRCPTAGMPDALLSRVLGAVAVAGCCRFWVVVVSHLFVHLDRIHLYYSGFLPKGYLYMFTFLLYVVVLSVTRQLIGVYSFICTRFMLY